MVNKAIDAFTTGDKALAEAVIASDDQIDRLFTCVRDTLVASIVQNPTCGAQRMDDLMIAKYLERIGDHAQNIAEWVIFSITGEHKSRRIL
ncbi:MAG: PhoU domain-containing protein, partial [Clostridia bacterium]